MGSAIEFTGPHKWTAQARLDLCKSFACQNGADAVEQGVKDNTRQLWHVLKFGKRIGTLVTENVDQETCREFFIWCYQGQDIRDVLPAIGLRALHARIPAVGFFTPHWRAVLYGFKQYAPIVEDFGPPGEKRFTFKTENFANENRTERRRFVQRSNARVG